MTEHKPPAEDDIAKIKRALVSAGILKSTGISAADEEHLLDHLEKNGVDARKFRLSFKIICHSSHYCFIVRGL